MSLMINKTFLKYADNILTNFRSDGSVEVKYEVPDTLTSWMITAFTTNSKFGLGIASDPAMVAQHLLFKATYDFLKYELTNYC